MYRLDEKTATHMIISSDSGYLAIPKSIYIRAEGRHERNARIRKPVISIINGKQFIFTPKEVERIEDETLNYWHSKKEIRVLIASEIQDKIKVCKGFSKDRSAHVIFQAIVTIENR